MHMMEYNKAGANQLVLTRVVIVLYSCVVNLETSLQLWMGLWMGSALQYTKNCMILRYDILYADL